MCLLKTVGEAEATYPQSCPKPQKLTTYALYMESARITMERTMAQLVGLEETEKDVGS